MEIKHITIRFLKKIFADGFASPKNARNYSMREEARYEAQTNPFRQLAEDKTRQHDQSAVNDDVKMASAADHIPLADYLKAKFSPYSH
ncbi:MAG: hypothetical protein ACMUIL_03890 [bacterium]